MDERALCRLLSPDRYRGLKAPDGRGDNVPAIGEDLGQHVAGTNAAADLGVQKNTRFEVQHVLQRLPPGSELDGDQTHLKGVDALNNAG